MYGIFMECWVALKLYGGNGILLILFLVSSIYLIVSERDIKKKLLLGIIPLVIMAGFLLPVTKMVYVKLFDDGRDTYYRLLWLIPMYVVIGYGLTRALMSIKNKVVMRCILIVSLLVICVSGSCVYVNEYMSVAENLYHIPQTVIDICDVISPDDDEPRVRAAFPSELVHFVRQYDTDILMPFGREMVALQWDYYNVVYEVMEKPEIIDASALLEATRQTKCEYIVLSDERRINCDLADMGLEVVDNIDGYTIYCDPEIKK